MRNKHVQMRGPSWTLAGTSKSPGCLLLCSCLTWNLQGPGWTSRRSTMSLQRGQAAAMAKVWHPVTCHSAIPEMEKTFLKGPHPHPVKDVFSLRGKLHPCLLFQLACGFQ